MENYIHTDLGKRGIKDSGLVKYIYVRCGGVGTPDFPRRVRRILADF